MGSASQITNNQIQGQNQGQQGQGYPHGNNSNNGNNGNNSIAYGVNSHGQQQQMYGNNSYAPYAPQGKTAAQSVYLQQNSQPAKGSGNATGHVLGAYEDQMKALKSARQEEYRQALQQQQSQQQSSEKGQGRGGDGNMSSRDRVGSNGNGNGNSNQVSLHTYIHTYISINTYSSTYIHTYIHTCITHIHTHKHYTPTHAYIHTDGHTQAVSVGCRGRARWSRVGDGTTRSACETYAGCR